MATIPPPLPARAQSTEQGVRAEGSAQQGSVFGDPLFNPGPRTTGVVRVTAADVIAPPSPALPSLQSFEELGIPDSYRTTVENELTSGEKILWLGRQSLNPKVLPNAAFLPLIGLGLIGLGLVVIVLAVLIGFLFLSIFGGALALVGLMFQLPRMIDPSKADPKKFCRSCYVVTNRRAILVEFSLMDRGLVARSYLPHQLLGLECKKHPEVAGVGDLIFEYIFTVSGNDYNMLYGNMRSQGPGGGRLDAPQRVPRGFFLLDQVREVEHLIRTTLLGQLENALDGAKQSPGVGIAPELPAEAITVVCACSAILEAPGSLAGNSVKCPQCSAAVSIPDATAGHEQYQEDKPVPADLKAKAFAELDPKEKVVWVGQPVGSLIFVRNCAWLVGGSIGLLIALIWLIVALQPAKTATAVANQKQAAKTAPAPQTAAGANLLAPVGIFLLSLCVGVVPFVRWHFSRRTCYALTNRRALVYQEGLLGTSQESYPPLEVAAMRRSDSWLFRGHGDLIFRTVTVITTSRSPNGKSSQSTRTVHYGFLAITDPQEVGKLVRATLIDPFVGKLTQANSL